MNGGLDNAVIASRIMARASDISDLALQIGASAYQRSVPSQRDPKWRDRTFAGGLAFKTDGCYVCCVTYMAQLAGYNYDPPDVARELLSVGCFTGALLTHPEYVPIAFPSLRYDGTYRWHDAPANMNRVIGELERGPVIAEVDFQWRTQTLNQHFVVLLRQTDDKRDIWIGDPWDGSTVRILQKYAGESWDLARCIYGLRLLRPGD